MKCREKNIEKTFLKVENTEVFWEELKKAKVKVVMINEKGIIVFNQLYKLFAEFGEYLIISDSGWIDVCGEEEFNQHYEIIDSAESFDEKLNELRRLIEKFASEMKNITDVIPKINLTFGDLKETADVNEILKQTKEVFRNALSL